MNVGITTFGGDGGKSGISRYLMNLVRQFNVTGAALHDSAATNSAVTNSAATNSAATNSAVDNSAGAAAATFELYVYSDELDLFETSERMRPLEFSSRLRAPIVNFAWHQTRLASWCRRRKHDVLFLPAANRRAPLRASCPTVGTVHDLSGLHVRGKYDWARQQCLRHLTPRLIRKLTTVLTVSESSRRDILEHTGVPENRVRSIPLGVDHSVFRPICRAAARQWVAERFGLQAPLILYVSRIEHPGKNHVRLIRAFEQLKRKHGLPHHLLLPGSDWTRSAVVHRAAAESPYARQIHLPGFVPEEALPQLYSAADVFVFPSLYEGFGLPILEAMACGAAVACSDRSSLPEIAGGAAALFNPEEPDAIESTLAALLLDAPLRAAHRDRGLAQAAQYTWQRTAALTLAALREAAQC